MAKKAAKKAAGKRPVKKSVKKAAKKAAKRPAGKRPVKKAPRKKHPGRTGRPLKFGKRLRHTVPVGLTDEQINLIDEAAAIAGLKRAELVRNVSLDYARQVIERSGNGRDSSGRS